MQLASSGVDWRAFPLTLRAQHLSTIYGYTLLTVRKMAQQRNPKIPSPATARPFGWNRADVQRHYERRTA
jgi:hypothetical protein